MKRLGLIFVPLFIVALACGSEAPTAPAAPDFHATLTAVSEALNASMTQLSGTIAVPAEPSATPAAAFGNSRDNPWPYGSQVDIGGDLILTVGTVVRPADKNIQKYNMFNSTPEPGQEYAQVELQLQCTKASSDTCSLILLQMKAVGADGQVHDQEFVAGVPNELDTTGEMFGGATVKGNLMYLVPKGDMTVVLFVENVFGSKVYLALQ